MYFLLRKSALKIHISLNIPIVKVYVDEYNQTCYLPENLLLGLSVL
jgi:hypothetical protein